MFLQLHSKGRTQEADELVRVVAGLAQGMTVSSAQNPFSCALDSALYGLYSVLLPSDSVLCALYFALQACRYCLLPQTLLFANSQTPTLLPINQSVSEKNQKNQSVNYEKESVNQSVNRHGIQMAPFYDTYLAIIEVCNTMSPGCVSGRYCCCETSGVRKWTTLVHWMDWTSCAERSSARLI